MKTFLVVVLFSSLAFCSSKEDKIIKDIFLEEKESKLHKVAGWKKEKEVIFSLRENSQHSVQHSVKMELEEIPEDLEELEDDDYSSDNDFEKFVLERVLLFEKENDQFLSGRLDSIGFFEKKKEEGLEKEKEKKERKKEKEKITDEEATDEEELLYILHKDKWQDLDEDSLDFPLSYRDLENLIETDVLNDDLTIEKMQSYQAIYGVTEYELFEIIERKQTLKPSSSKVVDSSLNFK